MRRACALILGVGLAFGYMDRNVAISQRTINESAQVAHYLSTGSF